MADDVEFRYMVQPGDGSGPSETVPPIDVDCKVTPLTGRFQDR